MFRNIHWFFIIIFVVIPAYCFVGCQTAQKNESKSVRSSYTHCKRGIALYNQGRFEDAQKEFVISMRRKKSIKAELYLNWARKAWVDEKKDRDTRPPEVIIHSPEQGSFINGFSVSIQGIVRDDTFVQKIKINDKEFLVNIWDKEIEFRMEVPVDSGKNIIPVSVTDIAGKTSSSFLTVNVDRMGPIIVIATPPPGATTPETGISLKGYVIDDSGIEEMLVNNRSVVCNGLQELQLPETVQLRPEETEVVIKAIDLAGNETCARIPVSENWSLPTSQSGKQDSAKPFINIHARDGEAEHTKYRDYVFIDGNARSDHGVEQFAVSINDTLINKIEIDPGINIYFSHLFRLKEGQNIITVEAMTVHGELMPETVRLERQALMPSGKEPSLCIAVNCFDRNIIGFGCNLIHGFEGELIKTISNDGRFNVLEKEKRDELLWELGWGTNPLVDVERRLRLGKAAGADCMLFGSIAVDGNFVTIHARMVDTENSQYLAGVSVSVDKAEPDFMDMEEIAQRLAQKLKETMPEIVGFVRKVENETIWVEFDKRKSAKKGMRLFVYEIGEPIRNELTHEVICHPVIKVGRGTITDVTGRIYSAKIEIDSDRRIEQGQCAITQ